MDIDTNRILKMALEESIYNTIMESKVTDSCIDLFGKELFGEFRNKKEPDTEIEKDYFQMLAEFVRDNDKHPKLKQALLHLKKCLKDYPEILTPNSNLIYRGSTAREDLVKKVSLENINDVQKIFSMPTKTVSGAKFILADKSYTYSPKYEIQSWTTSISSALQFTVMGSNFLGDTRDYNYPCIYEFTAPKNQLIFSTKFTNAMGRKLLGQEEFEIIRIGKNAKVKAWIHLYKFVYELWMEYLFTIFSSYGTFTSKNFHENMDKYYLKNHMDGFIKFLVPGGYNKKELEDVFFNKSEPSSELLKDINSLKKLINYISDY